MAALHFPHHQRALLSPYLPPHAREPSLPDNHKDEPSSLQKSARPFVTLTYAQSLDSQIALGPGQQTALSGPSSKAMTHYLRSTHDAILVGSGTAIADDPSLNCRLDDVVDEQNQSDLDADDKALRSQPQPVILDRRARWPVQNASKVVQLAVKGRAKAPWIFVSEEAYENMPSEREAAVVQAGGIFIVLQQQNSVEIDFPSVLAALATRGIRSLMIEGGATVINQVLSKHKDLVDSLIVTIAPTFLGQGGVTVCPSRENPSSSAVNFHHVQYLPLDRDVVMCCKLHQDAPSMSC